MSPEPTKIALFGCGAFGLPIACHLQRHNSDNRFVLHAYDTAQEVIASLREHRRHAWLYPEVEIPEGIVFHDDARDLVVGAEVIILAVPSVATTDVLTKIKPDLQPGAVIVNTAKALDSKTGRRLSQVAAEALQGVDFHYAALYGGTIAKDLMAGGQPLGMDCACTDMAVAQRVAKLVSSRALRVYATDDLVGVEYAGALKNVVSIMIGMTHGLGFCYGSETHLFSRAAIEVSRFATANGARPETFTFQSQSWGSDAVMSATGLTRNREFGIRCADMTADAAKRSMDAERRGTIEGISTCSILREAVEQAGQAISDYPILDTVCRVVLDNVPARQAFVELMETNF